MRNFEVCEYCDYCESIYIFRGEVMRENRLQLTGSVCMPSSCSFQKILTFVNRILNVADLEMRSDREANACTTGETPKFEIIDWIFM